MKVIGKRINELRLEKKLTQKELANAVNIGQASISEWEKGTHEPNATAIKILAVFFGVSADYLLGLEDETGSKTYNNYGTHIGNVKF